MTNDLKETIIEDADIQEADFTPEELADENFDWKAESLKLKGLNQRRATKLRKLKENLKPEIKPKTEVQQDKIENKKEVDYARDAHLLAQETYFIANGIKGEDEIELAKRIISETGKSEREVVGMKYFQSELKELRDARATKDALPSSSKRSTTTQRDSVDYWLAKLENGGKLFDIPDVKLRREVVNARMARGKQTNHFTDRPFG